MRGIFMKFGVLAAAVATVGTLGLGSSAQAYGFYGHHQYPHWSYPNASIYGTGPWSNNYIGVNPWNTFTRVNNNNIGVTNNNVQNALSGAANVSGNLFGGNAISGPASNFNSTNTNIGLTNF